MVVNFIAIYALGEAKLDHVLGHVSTIVEYLNIKCTSHNDNLIVRYVAKILEFTIPFMKSASSSIARFSAVIRLSKNKKLVKKAFVRCFCKFIGQSSACDHSHGFCREGVIRYLSIIANATPPSTETALAHFAPKIMSTHISSHRRSGRIARGGNCQPRRNFGVAIRFHRHQR